MAVGDDDRIKYLFPPIIHPLELVVFPEGKLPLLRALGRGYTRDVFDRGIGH